MRVPGQDRRGGGGRWSPATATCCWPRRRRWHDARRAAQAGRRAKRPVMGVACGSIGVLTSVPGDAVGGRRSTQVAEGRWTAVDVPALGGRRGSGGRGRVAINDVAVIRAGPGQVLVSVSVDGVLYVVLWAGDGCRRRLAARVQRVHDGRRRADAGAGRGGHGGHASGAARRFVPAAGGGARSRVSLRVQPGHGGVRYEIDGRSVAGRGAPAGRSAAGRVRHARAAGRRGAAPDRTAPPRARDRQPAGARARGPAAGPQAAGRSAFCLRRARFRAVRERPGSGWRCRTRPRGAARR